jgi:hypothetical protein
VKSKVDFDRGRNRVLYLRYTNEKNIQDGKTWETVVLEDFAELRKEGFRNPTPNALGLGYAKAVSAVHRHAYEHQSTWCLSPPAGDCCAFRLVGAGGRGVLARLSWCRSHQPRDCGLADVESPRHVCLCLAIAKPLECFGPLMGC